MANEIRSTLKTSVQLQTSNIHLDQLSNKVTVHMSLSLCEDNDCTMSISTNVNQLKMT